MGLEVIAKIAHFLVLDILCLLLATLMMSASIVETTIETDSGISAAGWTFRTSG
jgi:hypothetical protein